MERSERCDSSDRIHSSWILSVQRARKRSVRARRSSNFAAYAVASLDDFKITRGADKLKWYESSSKARRGFCPDCGSSIFKDNLDGERIVLSVGALNPPIGLGPLKDIFTESKGDWYEL
jgi:hypothetical protein